MHFMFTVSTVIVLVLFAFVVFALACRRWINESRDQGWGLFEDSAQHDAKDGA